MRLGTAALVVVAAAAVSPAVAPPLAAQARPDPGRRDTPRRPVPPAPGDTARADTARVDTARAPLTRAAADSLAARLARAEAAIALLRQELAAESESVVRTRSRLAFDLSARVLTNAYRTSRPADDAAVPSVAVPSVEAYADASAGAVVRQTRVGAALTVRDVLGGTLDGDLDLDFYGGARDASGERPLFAEPRLRTVRAWLRWPAGAVMVGAETPLVSDLDPLSLAAVGVPLFGGAGNLWNWLPQVRVSREVGHTARAQPGPGATRTGRALPRPHLVRWAVQGAVLAPYAGVAYEPAAAPAPGAPYTANGGSGGDAGPRSGRPSLEGRLRARWGAEDPDAPPLADARDFAPGEGPSEVGVGAHRGWLRTADVGLVSTGAITLDARVAFAGRWELRGEAYAGRLVAGLGGGGIGQAFGQTPPGAAAGTRGAAVRDAAGWGQLNVQAARTVLAGAGCGVDRARDADRPDRLRNLACAAHVRWRPAQPLLVGLEYRRLATRYAGGRTFGVDHVNLAFGFDL